MVTSKYLQRLCLHAFILSIFYIPTILLILIGENSDKWNYGLIFLLPAYIVSLLAGPLCKKLWHYILLFFAYGVLIISVYFIHENSNPSSYSGFDLVILGWMILFSISFVNQIISYCIASKLGWKFKKYWYWVAILPTICCIYMILTSNIL